MSGPGPHTDKLKMIRDIKFLFMFHCDIIIISYSFYKCILSFFRFMHLKHNMIFFQLFFLQPSDLENQVAMVTWEWHFSGATDGELPTRLSVLVTRGEPVVDQQFVLFLCVHIHQL